MAETTVQRVDLFTNDLGLRGQVAWTALRGQVVWMALRGQVVWMVLRGQLVWMALRGQKIFVKKDTEPFSNVCLAIM